MTDGIEVGGSRFLTVQETTVEQDMIFLDLVRKAGIDRLVKLPEETPEDFSDRILGALASDGTVLQLLGCLLVPPAITARRGFRRRSGLTPREWTPAVGEEVASFLGSLKAPEDKAAVRGLVLTLIVHFFESGTVSLWTTQTSSDEPVPERSPEMRAPTKPTMSPEEESARPEAGTDAGRRSS